MKRRIHFTVPVALVCILLPNGARAQSSRIGPAEIYPDPVRTPGAANPDVTQENIQDNISNRHWSTKQIRPPAEYTSKLKREQLREYGDTVHQTRAQLINPITGKVDTTRCVPHSRASYAHPTGYRLAIGRFKIADEEVDAEIADLFRQQKEIVSVTAA